MELPHKIRNNIIIISLVVLICGLLVMTGWVANVPAFQKLLVFHFPIKFNTGLCFSLFAAALLALLSGNKTYNTILFYALAVSGTALGLLTFSEALLKFNCGIDTLFIGDKTLASSMYPFHGRMASNSSFNFSVLGAGLLMIKARKQLYRVIAQYFFHLVTLLSAIVLTGYIYGVLLLHTLFYITAIPPHTATLFLILSIAASLCNPTFGINQVFTGQLVGNRMARRLLFMMALAVIFLAILRTEIQEMHLFASKDVGVSLLAVCFLLMSLLLIWNTAVWLNRTDIRRQEAEDKVIQINAQLEKLVEERSAELRETELKFRTLAERSMVGVYIVQGDSFIYVNPRFAHIFGYEPAELINTKSLVEKIFHKDQHQMIRENMRLRLAGEVDSVHYEVMGKRKNGTTNWVEFYGNAVTIGGEPTIIGSMIDITERKKAEEELKSSEQKYKLLFESNPMPLWMIDKDNLKIIAANEAAAKHYGYTKEELINMDMRLFRPTEDKMQQMEGYQKEMDGDLGIVRHRKKDGSVIYVQIVAHDIIFEGKHVRLSMSNDVTERMKAEESLQKSEANFRAILRTTDTAYALFDRELKVLACNQKAAEFIKEQYGYDDGYNTSIADYLPADRFPDPANLANNVLKGNNINFEIDFAQPDGTVTWYYARLFPITNDHKAILGVLMALYDITERKNAEHDLKTAYSRIQSHINSIKDMAWKQSHLMRSPLANLKGLTAMLQNDITDKKVLEHIQTELDRMDSIIIEMAEDVSEQYYDDESI
jgi:PAS domain S-box-containing protein